MTTTNTNPDIISAVETDDTETDYVLTPQVMHAYWRLENAAEEAVKNGNIELEEVVEELQAALRADILAKENAPFNPWAE